MTPNRRCTECGQVLPRVKAERRKKRKAEKKNGRLDARRAVRLALKAGVLKKGPCKRLGQGNCTGRISAHHYLGYQKQNWLKVEWLCGQHHGEADREQSSEHN